MSDVARAPGVAVLHKIKFEQNPGGREGASPSRAFVFQKEGKKECEGPVAGKSHHI